MKTIRILGFWICLALGLGLGVLAQRPPAPLSDKAPPGTFSAGRAMVDVRVIARRPHPTGSAEIARVRDHLLTRLGELGLEVSMRPGEGQAAYSRDGRALGVAAVQNVVGVLPGRDREAPAVLVMSHYDSVSNSPGAADDGMGTAAALEIARALKTGAKPLRDVIFLFTDGEEVGLMGADAFFARDPLAARVGVVVNMEARGDSGRVAMFQTGPENGTLLALMARTALGPSANSLASTVYEKMPNDTDFTHALAAKRPGLNFALIDNQLAYHTPLSTPERLNQGSLQHLGDQVLPVVQALARETALPPKAPNAIYSDLLGLILIHYPAPVGWALLALAAGLIGFSAARAIKGGATTPLQLARGLAGSLLLTLAAALVLHLTGRLLAVDSGQRLYDILGRFDLLLWGAAALGTGAGLLIVTALARGSRRLWPSLLALALGGACSLVGGFDPVGLGLGAVVAVLIWACLGPKTGVMGVWLGGLALLLLLSTAAQVLAPGATVMLVWPLLVASLGAALVLALGGTRDRRVALLLTLAIGLLAALTTAQVTAWGGWTFAGIGLMEPAVLAVFVLLATPALVPLAFDFAESPWGWTGVGLTLATGLGLCVAAGLPAASPERPNLTEAHHLSDPGAGKAWRVSTLPQLDAWSRATIIGDGGLDPVRQALPPFVNDPVWMSETRLVTVDPPSLGVERSGERLLVRVIPGPGAEVLTLKIRANAALSDPRLNGRPVTLASQPGAWSSVTYFAPDPNGVTLSFTTPARGRIEAAVMEYRDGWPGEARAPSAKPSDLMATGMSDKTAVIARASLGW
ncbi:MULTISPECIES: M20/M25/M40 family metallo-hydrolase [unclassified Caulobacter]|uniref:M20/M25/M40 family metallo-hydrolase n=1 Tax=unclassified Caulobacter TaxID=2648921 RepID=UPI000D3D5063|nr:MULTISPECIES: M20/M25/M40 family metallo-hydrolase [unclassified Caulobacter]PTS81775.1 peptidase M20 [Caulobacter sp. HMWF009]PTT06868.1 peptidase M20 [Caulobacter sp. HMWF025]